MGRIIGSTSAISGGPRPASRLVLSIFFAFFFLLGAFFTLVLGRELYLGLRTWGFQSVPCTILSSGYQTDRKSDSENPYTFEVEFSYYADGQERRSKSYRRGSARFASVTEARSLVNRYPAESRHSCFVDPEDPNFAVLERTPLWWALFLPLPLIFIAIGGGGIYFIWRRKSQAISDSQPLTARVQIAGRGAMLFLGGAFALIGGALIYPLGIQPALVMNESRSWSATECTVIDSRVRAHDGDSDSGTTYSIDIHYSYAVDGLRYESDRYRIGETASSEFRSKQAIVDRFPPGTVFTCYYSPDRPDDAVIEPGFSLDLLIGVIPLVFLVVGLSVFFGARSPSPERPGIPSPMTAEPKRAMGRSSREPLVLKPQVSAAGSLLVVIFIALFWNGIISVFVVQVVNSWLKGDPEYFLTLFMVPFVLVGAGLLLAIPYSALKILNPVPELTLIPGTPALGEKFTVRWRFSGQVGRLEALTVTLQGVEQAVYRRGTDTYTSKETFYEQLLKKSSNRLDFQQGEAAAAIPEAQMHSFSASHNKIIWSIVVHGKISRWPDVSESFEITVLPLRKRETSGD